MERIEKALQRSRSERELLRAHRSEQAPARPEASIAPRPQEPRLQTRQAAVDPACVARAGLLDAALESEAAHSFRMVRALLTRRMRPRGWTTLAVVSPTSVAGKSAIAANIAIALAAEQDQTALLVDLQLSRPRVHELFGVDVTTGLGDCLESRSSIPQALIAPQEYPGLVMMPAHAAAARTSELLGSPRAQSMFKEFKQRYVNRYVVYDVPPVLSSDDAIVFVPQADAVLVVVEDNRTRREDLLRCLDLLQHVPVLGTVLGGDDRGNARQRLEA